MGGLASERRNVAWSSNSEMEKIAVVWIQIIFLDYGIGS